ncbi:hypothetical protein MHYP_G00075350 [Metynnis hypsauchen]
MLRDVETVYDGNGCTACPGCAELHQISSSDRAALALKSLQIHNSWVQGPGISKKYNSSKTLITLNICRLHQ